MNSREYNKMKTHTHLFRKLCSYENLLDAFEKARKGKSKKPYVEDFEKNLNEELISLQKNLVEKTYQPHKLKKFIVRDPKTRTIHASAFRDRIVHHAVVKVLEPIFEKIFINDSFASRKTKGTHSAVERFEYFMRKVSGNGRLIRNAPHTNAIQGYVFKADVRHYFDTINHNILLSLLRKKIKDEDVLWLVKVILDNFETPHKCVGVPLGNYTSQFFGNVYLNELDYFVKHILKVKYYIRYVDDFVILHKRKKLLEYYKKRIAGYIECLQLKIHPDKSHIHALRNGITFLGYRVFYNYKLLRKRNLRIFSRKLEAQLRLYKEREITKEELEGQLQGWFGYAQWANTYKFRKKIAEKLASFGGGGNWAFKINMIEYTFFFFQIPNQNDIVIPLELH